MSKPEFSNLEWLEEEIGLALSESFGRDVSKPSRLARDVLRRLAERAGGAYVYIPSASALRRADIRASFTGDNAQAVAAEHGVSVRTVYRLGKR